MMRSEKYEKLKTYICSFDRLAVAFSGGVDSALLLYAAKDALGDRAIAVTAESGSFPVREQNEAREFCRKLGVTQKLAVIEEMKIPGLRQNPENRCYLCKKVIFKELIRLAGENGIATVAEGSNLDDEGDYRPGLIAIKELGVKSPLRELAFTKEDIRTISRELGIPVWNKPSFACLATRIPYGDEITPETLAMVDRGEQYLMDLGYKQVRVRVHRDTARIELPPGEIEKFIISQDYRKAAVRLKEIGFAYAALDLNGYRTGSMNEVLDKAPDGQKQ